jgi:hypothetical protein
METNLLLAEVEQEKLHALCFDFTEHNVLLDKRNLDNIIFKLAIKNASQCFWKILNL